LRSRRYTVITRVERLNNRLTRFALRRGWAPRAFALLETVGRRSGQPRHTPVGNGLVGETFWLIAAHGVQADYVRNIQADPAVRVKVNGRWREGTATLLVEDDTDARSRTLPYRWDAWIGRRMATTPVTVRIDLHE
jgi:deazaflavin-dependent oxidoreductase (nitroreductase family)